MSSLASINAGAYNVAHVALTENILRSNPRRRVWDASTVLGHVVTGTDAVVKVALDELFGAEGWKVTKVA